MGLDHGTLLLNADLSALAHLLYIDTPSPDAAVIISGKDTASVRAPHGVVNLTELPTVAGFSQTGAEAAAAAYVWTIWPRFGHFFSPKTAASGMTLAEKSGHLL